MMRRRRMNRAILGCFLVISSGCSLVTAGEAQPRMLDAIADSDSAEADSVLSTALGAPDGKLPEKRHSFTDLLLAERGVVRLSAGNYQASAADLGLADKLFDVRD